MTSIFKRSRFFVSALVLSAGAVLGYQALGAAMAAGQPTAVVTVNLSKVIEKLDQRRDEEANFKIMVDAMKDEDSKQQDDIKKMEEDLKKMSDSSAKEDLQEKYALAALKYQSWSKFNSEKLDIEYSLILRDLYQAIKLAVAQMAASSKFDLVLVDDSQGEVNANPDSKISRKSQIEQQIAGRRMLFANPAIDVTEDLIVRMNNAYKAQGKAAAAGAPAPAAGAAGKTTKPKTP